MVRADPTKQRYLVRLNEYIAQISRVGNNYNQVVKAINTYLSRNMLPRQIDTLVACTRELKALSEQVLELTKRLREEWLITVINKLNERLQRVNAEVQLKRILYYLTKLNENETFENKGIAKIQDEMIECEKRIVSYLVSKNLLNQDSYLIKDGSIQYKPMKTGNFKDLAHIRNNYRHVIGVSKKFNPNIMKDNKDQSSAGQIARLPLYHRTPAFLWQPGEQWGNVNFAIWYVRIRDIGKTESPYAGILKVEKMLMTGKETEYGLSSDEVDTITANLINERNPVCYGTDARWANHLYPVYMTECYCKSRFKSDYYFLNLF